MIWNIPNLRLHQSRLVIVNVLQQRAQTQIILQTMITLQQVNNEDKYFVEHTFVIVSVKKIDKKNEQRKVFQSENEIFISNNEIY